MIENFELNKKKGISGCKLELIDNKIIRKSSNDVSYNKRLQNQMNKQINFYKISKKKVDTPSVLNYGVSNNFFYFDMEYISGKLPFEFFLTSTIDEINEFYKKISFFLKNSEKKRKKKKIYFFKKNVILKLETLENNSQYKSFIKFIKKKVKDLEINFFYENKCHGDFTLSNMICHKDKVILIDFLDSFIESTIIDLVKLKQDLVYNWSILNYDDFSEFEKLKIKQVSFFLWKKLKKDFNHLIENELFSILECINFLRIEPYIKEKKMLKTLNTIISKTKYYEEFNNSNGR